MTPEEQMRQAIFDWIKVAPITVQMALRPEHVTGLVDMILPAIRTAENEALERAAQEADDRLTTHLGHAGDFDSGCRAAARDISERIRALKHRVSDGIREAGKTEGLDPKDDSATRESGGRP